MRSNKNKKPTDFVYIFTCSVCGERKDYNYVPKDDICRSCAAKQRKKSPSGIKNISSDVSVTKHVERRLRKKANREIQPSKEEIRNTIIYYALFAVVLIPPFFIASELFIESSGLWWAFVLAWIFGLGAFNAFFVKDKLDKPRNKRMQAVDARVVELAKEREVRIYETRLFYGSPEWIYLRRLVIEEDGKYCTSCRRYIYEEEDITVDHIKPRSKYPELQLSRDNLQVLCRSCNSKKGNREWWEENG